MYTERTFCVASDSMTTVDARAMRELLFAISPNAPFEFAPPPGHAPLARETLLHSARVLPPPASTQRPRCCTVLYSGGVHSPLHLAGIMLSVRL
jgi:hypothetical protein